LFWPVRSVPALLLPSPRAQKCDPSLQLSRSHDVWAFTGPCGTGLPTHSPSACAFAHVRRVDACRFEEAKLRPPEGIHKGFFGSLADEEYPRPVAFAFFDGDLYSSIYQSFERVWPKVSDGGVVMVHDFAPSSSRFPGAKAATEAYLRSHTRHAPRVDECYDIVGKVQKGRGRGRRNAAVPRPPPCLNFPQLTRMHGGDICKRCTAMQRRRRSSARHSTSCTILHFRCRFTPSESCEAPFRDFNIHAPRGVAWLRSSNAEMNQPIRSHAWVEVTHCGGSFFEQEGSWYYVMRGSGTYVSTGRTVAFERHAEAAAFFLNVSACDEPTPVGQCNDEIPRFLLAARRRGFDSVQFTRHCDDRCHACGHELVLTRQRNGGIACPKELRSGFGASRPCTCAPWLRSVRGGQCGACADVMQRMTALERRMGRNRATSEGTRTLRAAGAAPRRRPPVEVAGWISRTARIAAEG